MEGHAEFASDGKSPPQEASDQRGKCAEAPVFGALCSNSPERTGAGIKPGPSDPSVTVESLAELARFINGYTGNDENGNRCARALLDQFEMIRRK